LLSPKLAPPYTKEKGTGAGARPREGNTGKHNTKRKGGNEMTSKKESLELRKAQKVRQEGRRGMLHIDEASMKEIGQKKVYELLNGVGFQMYRAWFEEEKKCSILYGYCPLFASLKMDEKAPIYTMRVDFKDPEPIVEMIERRKANDS